MCLIGYMCDFDLLLVTAFDPPNLFFFFFLSNFSTLTFSDFIRVCDTQFKELGMKVYQWIRILATTPDNLCLIPGIHMVGGSNQLLKVGLWPSHMCLGTHMLIHMETHIYKHTNLITTEKLGIRSVNFQMVNSKACTPGTDITGHVFYMLLHLTCSFVRDFWHHILNENGSRILFSLEVGLWFCVMVVVIFFNVLRSTPSFSVFWGVGKKKKQNKL